MNLLLKSALGFGCMALITSCISRPSVVAAQEGASTISLSKSKETLSLKRGETPILTYHVAEVPPPDGVDPIYRRNGARGFDRRGSARGARRRVGSGQREAIECVPQRGLARRDR